MKYVNSQMATDRGKEARNAGIPREACPYRQRKRKMAWLFGWDEQGRLLSRQQVTDETRDGVRAGLSALRDQLRHPQTP